MKKTMAIFLLVFSLMLAACSADTSAAASEAAAAAVAQTSVEVEITLDNWQEYFEQREAVKTRVNESGAVIMREFGYGIFLKEEYVACLAEDGVDVTFEMQIDSVRYQVMGDLYTDNFIIMDDALLDEGEQIVTAGVEDLRGNSDIEPDSDLYNTVAAFLTVEGEFAG